MNKNNDIVISTKNLSKVYKLYKNPKDRLKEALSLSGKIYHKDFYALKNIDLEIKRGEVIGIVGKNGSGKSTLLKILSRVLTPTSGDFMVKGKVSSLLELGSGFNPELTGIENIYFYATILGITEQKIKEKLQEILDFADIGDFIYQPLKTYSSGMKARLAFSVAINVDPDILILDEVLAVGDELFRRKCYARMEGFFKGGKTILFVSHSVQSVNELCTRAILLNKGRCILEGPTKMITSYYQKMLFSSNEDQEVVMREIAALNTDTEKKKLYLVSEPETVPLVQQPSTEQPKPEPVKSEEKTHNQLLSLLKGQEKPFFMQGYEPKSTIKIINYNLTVTDIAIKSLNGEPVNHLLTGEDYIFGYSIIFNQTMKNMKFGMGIIDEKGYVISWILHPVVPDVFIEKEFKRESIVSVRTRFSCLLTKGVYYMGIGIRTFENGESRLVAKIKDCTVFKVLKADVNVGGKVILTHDVEVSYSTNN